MCLLSYSIPSNFVPVAVSHGNSKCKTPFYPTLPSTKSLVKSGSKFSGPKRCISIVSAKVGGVLSASSPCELPCNERQVTYLKRCSSLVKCGQSSGSDVLADQVFTMMQQAKIGDHSGKFVRDTRPSPEPAFVLARDRQLDDVVRFCTPSSSFSILTVDPTFNLGEFDVTPTAYQNLLLQSVRYGTSPIFIGPTTIHYRKTFHTYLFFAATLIGLRRELQWLRAFGTDGEKALGDAFAHEFHFAVRLTCFIHCRRNIKERLHDQHFSESEMKNGLDDIFGCKHEDVFAEGLVDANSENEFDKKLETLQERWKAIKERNAAIKPGFGSWFSQYKA